jgi:hypothetical protein
VLLSYFREGREEFLEESPVAPCLDYAVVLGVGVKC